jgi:hypothetical protein
MTPLGAEYEASSKLLAKRRRRESEYSSRTEESCFFSYILCWPTYSPSSADNNGVDADQTAPSVAHHRKYVAISGAGALKSGRRSVLTAAAADRLTTMLNSGPFSREHQLILRAWLGEDFSPRDAR